MKWPFNPCRRLEADVNLLAMGGLTEEERVKLEAHLANCPACRAKLAEMQTLTSALELLGKRLPQVEPTIMLRRRWQAAVRQSPRPSTESSRAWLLVWFSGRRAAWGGLAAIWLLVIFFRFSAPQAPGPAAVATEPISLREVLLALKVDHHKAKSGADAGNPKYEKQSYPDALPPRSQLPLVRPADSEVV